MIERTERLDWARLAAGIAVLVIGIALLSDLSGVLGNVRFFEFWPLILIVVGISRFADAENWERRRGGLTLTFIGCWLLIASLEIFGYDYGDSWPLVLVAIGLAVLLTARHVGDWGKGIFFLLLGAWFLVTMHGYLGLSMEDSWPFAIVAVGLWICFTAVFGTRRKKCSCSGECCCVSTNASQGE